MSTTRSCKGYLVECKNPAVKGRLFCFTCAGRKSRNKKTLALESCERECQNLRLQLAELLPQLNARKEVKKCHIDDYEVSGAANALLSFSVYEPKTYPISDMKHKNVEICSKPSSVLSWDEITIVPCLTEVARAEGIESLD